MIPTRALALAAALWCSACAKGTSQPGRPADIQQHVALKAVASCDELTGTVQAAAVLQMRRQLDVYKKGLYPVAYGGADGTPGATPAAPPAGYTTTNNQVAGVDEADFMKNDGTRIFVLSGDSLYAAKSWPPRELAVAGRLPIEGWPQSMFLRGDTVVVLSSLWSQSGGGGGGACPLGAARAGLVAMCRGGAANTKVTVVDVSSLAAPKVISETYLPGYGSYARRVDSSVRLVLADSVRWPKEVKWWPEWRAEYNHDHDQLVAAIDALENANEAVIRQTPAQSWFPNGTRKLADGSLIDVSYQCTDFFVANAPERLGLLTVVTLDLDHPAAPPARASIIGEPGVVYATAQNLYVASEHWWWWEAPGQEDHTYLHQFDISDKARTSYVGSGGVAGHVGNQFALDEFDGYLRVAATTIRRPKSDSDNGFHLEVGNHVAVFGRRGSELEQVGDSGMLAAGEGIRGVRFVGDRGFVDTFRGIDPLITLDLRAPARPRKIAELTMPGFSTYLQPIDEGHLLAIGTDLPAPDPVTGQVDWSRRALQLSVFDVSDLSHPSRSAVRTIGTMAAWSEALYDHHAFNWYGPRNLLAIPFSDWRQSGTTRNWYDDFVSDVRILKVNSTSIEPAGSLGMGDVYIQAGAGHWSYRYQPWVRRSVLATDDAGHDYVYAISDAGLRVADLADLNHPLATALFPASRTP